MYKCFIPFKTFPQLMVICLKHETKKIHTHRFSRGEEQTWNLSAFKWSGIFTTQHNNSFPCQQEQTHVRKQSDSSPLKKARPENMPVWNPGSQRELLVSALNVTVLEAHSPREHLHLSASNQRARRKANKSPPAQNIDRLKMFSPPWIAWNTVQYPTVNSKSQCCEKVYRT